MTRQQANKEILNLLGNYVENYPDIRFKQLLIDLKISRDSHNDFNEESVTTLKKLPLEPEMEEVKSQNSTEVFMCLCENLEHHVIVTLDGFVYVHVHMNTCGFFKRLIQGIKYIFGYKSKTGQYDEFILKPEDSEKLQKVVDYLKL